MTNQHLKNKYFKITATKYTAKKAKPAVAIFKIIFKIYLTRQTYYSLYFKQVTQSNSSAND